MPMPEATVHEYGESMSWKDQIGAAGKVLPVQTETQAELVCDAPDEKLGSGVPPLDSGHHLAPSSAIDDVGHVSGSNHTNSQSEHCCT